MRKIVKILCSDPAQECVSQSKRKSRLWKSSGVVGINRLRIIFLILLLIGGCQGASGQSLFRNLNFEQAKTIPLEGGSYYPYEVAATNGIPYWKAYTWDGSDSSIHYDDVALDSPWVSIHDTNSPWVPVLEGQYTMLLQSSPFFGIEVAIAQTGWVPVSAKSIRFLSANFRGLRVRFEANEIPIALLGQSAGTSGYIWGGDISQFAGQTGELRFSGGAPLDDIKFSPDLSPRPPALSEPELNVDGSFEFRLLGQTGQTYTLQFSTNFTNWTALTNVAGSVGPITIMDLSATNSPARFYRAVSP